MRIQPFRFVRPEPERAPRLACPPYDVLSRAEARRLAERAEESFVRIVRADHDFPETVPGDDPGVHRRAAGAYAQFLERGWLRRESSPRLAVYREVQAGHAQTGVVACVSTGDHVAGRIVVHEDTRPEKENERVQHMLAVGAHTEPVLLTYRARAAIDELVAATMRGRPFCDFSTADGVRHTLWFVERPDDLVAAFADVSVFYVADGHHRCAAAVRVAEHAAGVEEARWFPAVLVPDHDVRILAYDRLVADLNGLDARALRRRLADVGRLVDPAPRVPERPGSFSFYLEGRWFGLELEAGGADPADPAGSLDAALLQRRVLGPILGIGDPRRDPRLSFVGGRDALDRLERAVDEGRAALAVSLRPVSLRELFEVADRGGRMPPKSTWFEPKLASGLFVHEFGD